MSAENQDLIERINFKEIIDSAGKEDVLKFFSRVLELGYAKTQYYGVENVLIYVYLCKHYVNKPKDISFVTRYLSDYFKYMSDADKKIVFQTFVTCDLIDVINEIETRSNIFRALTNSDTDRLIDTFTVFPDETLKMFVDITGAQKFVSYIKLVQAEKQKEIEARRKAELERAQKFQAEAEARERKKQEYIEKRNRLASKRLAKLAENFGRGNFKYSMKVPFGDEITKYEISRLSHDDAGVRAMIRALVDMQTKIKTPQDLKTFNDMLKYMESHVEAKKCLHNVSLAEMLAIVGLSEDDLKKPGKTPNAIARYKEVMSVINDYPYVFKEGFGLDSLRRPHDADISINEYESGLELALLKKAEEYSEKARKGNPFKRVIYRRVSEALKGASGLTQMNNNISKIVYKDKKDR